jgi:hypothetical protein
VRSNTFDTAGMLGRLLLGVAFGVWSCSAQPRLSASAPAARAETRPVSVECQSFIGHFQPLYEKLTTGAVFQTPEGKLPLIFPSADAGRIDEIDRALAARAPAEAEADLTRRMLEAAPAHVETMRALLAAVSAEDVTTYRRVSTRYFETYQDLQAINRDCEETCGRLLVESRLPPEVIQSTIREIYPLVRKCYEAGLARDRTLTGRISVKFIIDEAGGVRDIEAVDDRQRGTRGPDPGTERFFESLGFRSTAGTIDSAPLQDEQVIACIVSRFRTLRFPRPARGIVTVVYPIQLVPG